MKVTIISKSKQGSKRIDVTIIVSGSAPSFNARNTITGLGGYGLTWKSTPIISRDGGEHRYTDTRGILSEQKPESHQDRMSRLARVLIKRNKELLDAMPVIDHTVEVEG